MDITYDNLSNPTNLVTFDGVHNILKISEWIGGDNASITFTFSGNLQSTVTSDTQYYLTLLGDTVTNVMSPSNANNKRFYISSDVNSTAASFARALRNCSSIAVDFNIVHNGDKVILTAKTIGSKWQNQPYETSIPSTYLAIVMENGQSYSPLWHSKISLDIYNDHDETYVTSLEKNFYGEECAFDLSSVLATFSEYGKVKPYRAEISMIGEDGSWTSLGSISGNSAVGYIANQSRPYMELMGATMLLNDKGKLYVYGNTIPYSLLLGNDIGGFSVVYSLKDSAENEIYAYTENNNRHNILGLMTDKEWTIPSQYYDLTSYVDITVSNETYRFNVIKPLKAASGYKRVEWRNEYGGIGFFDFTSTSSESISISESTYEKNIFDFYEAEDYEVRKIYDNGFNKEVKVSSHLMTKDGLWIFTSLARSKRLWTYVDGRKVYIIPKNLEITEDGTYDGVYRVTLTYEYSTLDF